MTSPTHTAAEYRADLPDVFILPDDVNDETPITEDWTAHERAIGTRKNPPYDVQLHYSRKEDGYCAEVILDGELLYRTPWHDEGDGAVEDAFEYLDTYYAEVAGVLLTTA